jgi:hypothetical protein
MTAKAQEEKYGSGLKMGGKVKGYKAMHRMPEDDERQRAQEAEETDWRFSRYAPYARLAR